MLRSMTGFGLGESQKGRVKVTAEVRSVNHRFLDVSLHLPSGYSQHESEIKQKIRERLERGRVTVVLTVAAEQSEDEFELNREVLKRHLEALRNFAASEGLEDRVDLGAVLAMPDVFVRKNNEKLDAWEVAADALDGAIDGCVEMRELEGRRLGEELHERVSKLEGIAAELEGLVPRILEDNKAGLKKRISLLLEDGRLDENRIAMEAAVLAERADFTEELVRLRSHLSQFHRLIDEGGVVAKRLTFLLQEIHRECTTICTKAGSLDVINRVLEVKGESEKLREQVQNLE